MKPLSSFIISSLSLFQIYLVDFGYKVTKPYIFYEIINNLCRFIFSYIDDIFTLLAVGTPVQMSLPKYVFSSVFIRCASCFECR